MRLHSPHSASVTTPFDLAAVATLSNSLPADSLQKSIGKTLDLLQDALGAEATEVFLTEPGQQGMVLTSHRGLFRNAFSQIVRFSSGEGYPGLVLAGKEPILVDNLAGDARYLRTRVKELGFSSYVSVPLRSSLGIPGYLAVAFRRPEVDLQRTYKYLSWLSAPLGAAIEAHFLKLRDELHTLTDLVNDTEEYDFNGTLSRVLAHMIALGGAQGGVLSILNGTREGVAMQISQGVAPRSVCPALKGDSSDSCPALAVKHGIAFYGPRTSWPTACQQAARAGSVSYCIPMVASGVAVGVLVLNYYRLGALPPTWNLVPLEVAANAAGTVIRDNMYQMRQQRQTKAVFGQILRKAETGALVAPPTQTASYNATQEAQAPSLDIRCFGPFEFYIQGKLFSQNTVHRKKALTLLKILLAHNGRQLTKDALIEFLWPEGEPDTRTGQLYVLVHELRRLVELPGEKGKWQFIRNDGDRYYFSFQGSCHVDVREFNTLINIGRKAEAEGDRSAAKAAYESAIELYRGDFMEDEPFAEWCQQERDRLQQTCLDVLQRLASIFAGSQDWVKSARYLRTALRIDPIREEVHRSLMYSLWAGGRRDEAVRQYQVCKDLLRKELDVDPLPATEQLHKQICSRAGP